MPVIDEAETVTCPSCGWYGSDDDLVPLRITAGDGCEDWCGACPNCLAVVREAG